MRNTTANLLIDTASKLSAAARGNTAWDASVDLATSLGAASINIAQFQSAGYWPTWVRISMQPDGGFEEYFENGYMDSDPVLVARAKGAFLHSGKISLEEELKRGHLNEREETVHRLELSYGFSDFLAHRGRCAGTDLENMVVFCGDRDGTRALESLGQGTVAIVSSLIAFHVEPPSPRDPGGKVPALYEFLSDRERDVLCYLAQGHLNDEIAFRMGLSEVTVRFHQKNARTKMGARTREQAVGLAVARGLISL